MHLSACLSCFFFFNQHHPSDEGGAVYLEKSGDGQGSDTPVGVCDQVLQLHVTGSHCRWVLHGNLPNTVLINYIFQNQFLCVCL